MVPVLITIPGDDRGEVEELVLLINSEFIREQDLIMQSIGQQQLDMGKSGEVAHHERERVYTLSQSGCSTLWPWKAQYWRVLPVALPLCRACSVSSASLCSELSRPSMAPGV